MYEDAHNCRKAKAIVKIAAPPDDGWYSCVVTQAGMMVLYTRFCEISKSERKINLALVPVMKPGMQAPCNLFFSLLAHDLVEGNP
jgi:hypothetical protein